MIARIGLIADPGPFDMSPIKRKSGSLFREFTFSRPPFAMPGMMEESSRAVGINIGHRSPWRSRNVQR